jgi:hypothetical protein
VGTEPPNRVFLSDVRGGDQYLRVTWHPDSSTIVFSHWMGELCLASTPVALTEAGKLIDLQVRALSEVARRHVTPAALPKPPRFSPRVRNHFRPKLADVIDASTRFISAKRFEKQRDRTARQH